MELLHVCRRLDDPAGTRYLRFAVKADGQLRRLERGVASRVIVAPQLRLDDPSQTALRLAEAADHHGDVRFNDTFGTSFVRSEIMDHGDARELQERQVSFPVGFALFAREALSRPSYAAFYYRRGFGPLYGHGDLEEKVIGQQIVYRRLDPVELYRQVTRTMLLQGIGLETTSPLMWQYLDRYLLPQLRRVIPGTDCVYDQYMDLPAARTHTTSEAEAVAWLKARVNPRDEFLQLYVPTSEQISALLRDA